MCVCVCVCVFRSLLESSLDQTNLLLSHLQKAGIPVVWHGRLDGEPAPYCNNCMVCMYLLQYMEVVYNVHIHMANRATVDPLLDMH